MKPKGPAWPIVKRLLGRMRPHARGLILIAIGVLVLTAIDLAPPWFIRRAIDQLQSSGSSEGILRWAVLLLGLALVHGAIDFARLYASATIGQRITFDLRNAVFAKLSQLSFSFYDQARTGDLMSRVTADIDQISQFFGRAAVIILTNVLTLLGILVALFIWDWRMGLLFLLFLPVIVSAMFIYSHRVQPAMRRVRMQLGRLGTTLQETLTGIQVVKLFGREGYEAQRIKARSRQLMEASVDSARITTTWMPYANALMGFGTGLVLWFGGLGVIQDVISLGTLVGFTTYVGMLLRPIRQTGMMLTATLRAIAAAERVFEVLDRQAEITDAPDAVALVAKRGAVTLEHVDFAYAQRDGVLHDVNIDVAPGEMVALVGPSGAGKSTIVHLLPRFYEVSAGSVRIDGHDVRDVTVKSLRDAIGIAMQSVYLFDASIGENIAYGKPGASRAEIEEVARMVQLGAYIKSLPMGYETPVGERGVRLSGGQRQRLALARVLLRDPRILILDEPTSSVDAETERLVQAAYGAAREGRTTFVIAHRLWTVQSADQILVLDKGRIVERASGDDSQTAHERLLAQKGLYRQLYDLQFQGEAGQGGAR